MTSFRLYVAYLAVVAGVLAASPASAQGGRVAASVNFGFQSNPGDFSQRLKPMIYGEAATLEVSQDVQNGPLFDVGAGITLFGNIGVGVSYSRTSGDGGATISAQIPDPLYFDQPRSASASADGLSHTENAVHLQVFYRFAASPKLDIAVGVGPTFFSVKQELIDTVDVGGGGAITPRSVEASDSPVGFNVGADITYLFTKSIGAGVLLRYANASADYATPNGSSISLDAGGFQFGGGLRVRF